jgi:ribosomal protein L37AE/L43A
MDYLDPEDYGGQSPNGSKTCPNCGSSMEYDFHLGCWICNNPDCGGN